MSRISKDNLDKFFDYNIHYESRTLYIGIAKNHNGDNGTEDEICAEVAENAIKGLHILDISKSDQPITILLNTPGGHWYHGIAVYDAIKACQNHVIIKAIGQCMSMGSVILQAGDERLIYPNATVMIHDGNDGFSGTARDFERWGDQSKNQRSKMYEIYASKSKHPSSYWRRKCANDYIMTANKALEEGLVDKIVGE